MTHQPIGIDLGTTYSAVATVNADGDLQLVQNKEGGYLTPSVVFFEGEDIVAGDVAKDARVDRPQSTVEFVKLSMGTNRRFHFSGKEFTPIELSALLLTKLKQDAEAALGCEITDVVVTCPAYFGADRRDATEKAALIAGLKVRALINEPTAAAMAFGMGGDRTGTVLVFDLGGGTFDVTLIQFAADNQFEVLGTDGDAELGGKDLDDAIIELVMAQLQDTHDIDISSDMEAIAELRQKAEKAKHDLTSRQSTTVSMSHDGKKARIELTQAQFAAAIAPKLENMKFTLMTILDDCGLTVAEIDDVILVGGSTRVPAVRAMITDFFGKEPNSTIHPDEAVARGAALYAAEIQVAVDPTALSPEVVEKVKALPSITDIAPHSIGISILKQDGSDGLQNSIILPRGTALPTSIEDRYRTAHEGQTSAKIDVNEGEEEDLTYVKELGNFVLSFPSGRPAGSPIDVRVGLDLSGIIRVRAVDVESGKQEEIAIDYTGNLTAKEVQERSQWLSQQKVS